LRVQVLVAAKLEATFAANGGQNARNVIAA